MKNKTISPGDHSAGKGAMGEAITGNKQCWTRGEKPDINKIENSHVVAEVEEEVVP